MSTSQESLNQNQSQTNDNDDNNISNLSSISKPMPKILSQTFKYPSKQVSILLNDNNETIQKIMDRTKCEITINNASASTPTADSDQSSNSNEHKMVQITLKGTPEQIWNGHNEINHIRQNGHLKTDQERKKKRFGGRGFPGRPAPKKLINWDLNVNDPTMLQTINSIQSESESINWAIFKFEDSKEQNDNLKILSIDKYGDGGVSNLRRYLSNIKELKYCILRFDYGFEIKKNQIILIIWSPSTARNGQKRNIIPILRHKSLIKKTLSATYEITISIHSHLHSSFILSELHSKNLVPEILLRVTKRTSFEQEDDDQYNDDNDDQKSSLRIKRASIAATSTPTLPTPTAKSMALPPSQLIQQKTTPNLEYAKTNKFFASKEWTLKRLKQELANKYNMDEKDIQITHILYNVTTRSSKFNDPRQTEHVFNKEDLDKTLSDLKLYHGSRIYISSISANEHRNGKAHKSGLSNRFLAAQRTAQFTKTKTMSKTNKIKIKLKLSSHIQNMKSLKSMKKMASQDIMQNKKPKNVSFRVAKYEELDQKTHSKLAAINQQRPQSKSVVYTQQPSKQTKHKSQPTNLKTIATDAIDEDNTTIDDMQSISVANIGHYRQPSVSDNEIEMEENEQIKKAKSMPQTRFLTRTRSMSTTLTEGLSKALNVVDQNKFAEYIKPQIYESVVIEKVMRSPSNKASTPTLRDTQQMELDNDGGNIIEDEANKDNKDNYKMEVEEAEEKKEDTKDVTDNDVTILEDEESILPFPETTASLSTIYSSSDMGDMAEIECTLDLNEVFIVQKAVGRGKTAHVHYAIYKDECDIALKEFRFGRLSDKILMDFHKELETLKKLNHDNICRLLGHYIDRDSKQLYLAFEWLPCGCLYDVIHDKEVSIEYMDVLEMAIDIARGMKYLHSQHIIHRDLKSHNLLLDEAYRVKITDFGTAKSLEKISGTAYTEVGTGGYMAPEVIEPPIQGYDRKVDIFSYGVLLWEIWERKGIFDQRCLRNMTQLRQGVRPKISENCPIKFKNLIEQCWLFDPAKRPSFDEICKTLLSMYSELQQQQDDEM